MDRCKLNQEFKRYLCEKNIWWSSERLDYTLGAHFRGLTLDNRTVFEIGAGPGFFSTWCVIHGATEVVAIEPEATGSSIGVRLEFEELQHAIKLNKKVFYLSMTLEEYLYKYKLTSFDYILMHSVINHLDESATERLHFTAAEEERQRYKDIFKSLYHKLKPKGIISIYDVGRCNFWNDMKLRNPFGATHEYHKHQQPKVWKKLLHQSGYEFMDLLWLIPFRLRKMQRILSWKVPLYFTNSGFILRCKRS